MSRDASASAVDSDAVDPDTVDAASPAPTPLWRKLLPWVGTVAVIYFLSTQVPLADAWAATSDARLELFLPEMAAAVIFWFLVESRAFAYLFTRFNAEFSWAEARSLRGMSYLLTPINWNVGTAAIILYLRRSKSISAIGSGSSMLFYGMIDAVALGSLALVGVSLMPDSPELATLKHVVGAMMLCQIASLTIFMAPFPKWTRLERIRGVALFRSVSMATLRDFSILSGLRIAYFSGFVLIFWLGSASFGIEVPLVLAAAATPAILLFGSLPISPAGIGTQAAAMLYFFAPYGDDAAIVAFGLSFPVAITVARCLLGLVYVGDIRIRLPAVP